MLSLLRSIFGGPRTLEALARSGDHTSLMARLIESDVFVMGALQGEGLAIGDLTAESLLREARTAAESLSKRGEFDPFVYERDGVSRLPFFTSQTHAQTFAQELARSLKRTIPIDLLGVKGSLLSSLTSTCDVFVMNDCSTNEVILPVAMFASS